MYDFTLIVTKLEYQRKIKRHARISLKKIYELHDFIEKLLPY